MAKGMKATKGMKVMKSMKRKARKAGYLADCDAGHIAKLLPNG